MCNGLCGEAGGGERETDINNNNDNNTQRIGGHEFPEVYYGS